ncbi:hypothetical protein KEJ51_00500 [Candidatus Bathyarchaeota archaeon]|nr:hypothetical protein [Candidatus Bathyarchaeota archaeon]
MLKSPKKRYGVIECPNCRGLGLVCSSAKSHRCPYCGRVIKFGWGRVKSLYWSYSPRVASRVLARLKLERSK